MRLAFALVALSIVASPAIAQETAATKQQAAEIIRRPAHSLFGAHRKPTNQQPAAFGSYARGCLAGGKLLVETAPGWQAMRLSRNRNWGHPKMIEFIGRLSGRAQGIGWPRLYVGDIGQPRGGPMKSGHRSHQIGLDVDIWLRKPIEKLLTRAQRESISSHVVVAPDGISLNRFWTDSHHEVIRAAAEDPAVARIFVNAAIKRHMCQTEQAREGTAAASKWLRKVRPWRGHNAHFHVRLSCPPGSSQCANQGPPPPGSGCGAELAKWFPRGGKKTRSLISQTGRKASKSIAARSDQEVNPESPHVPSRTKKKTPKTRSVKGPLTLASLPKSCVTVLAGDNASADELAMLLPPNEMTSPMIAPVPARALVFRELSVHTHTGPLGQPFYWTPEVNEAALNRQDVRLTVQGWLPIGLSFVDRGGGNALLSGVPIDQGQTTFDIVAMNGDRPVARQSVTVTIGAPGGNTVATAFRSVDHKVRDFVTDFTGNECFYAAMRDAAEDHVKIEAFADDPAPFYVFGSAFKDAVGLDARIDRRIVTDAQCEPLAFARNHTARSAHAIEIGNAGGIVSPGQQVDVKVAGNRLRNISVLMVSPSGTIRELSTDGANLSNDVRLAGRAEEQGPGLLIAVDSARPLDYHRLAGGSDAEAVLALLTDEQAMQRFDIRTAIGYFIQQ